MIINNNIPALNTYRQMGVNQAGAQNSMEKLASGLRINRAGDDAAGLAISEKMRAQVRGLDQASRNAQDGISMIQTAEGALQETHSILQRMRELATQAANDTNVEVDRGEIQKEMNQLTSEINRIGNTTEFNTQKLLDGGKGGTLSVGVPDTGVDATDASTISFEITKNLVAGQTVTVNGTEYTAINDGEGSGAAGAPGATQFVIGADENATATNLAGQIDAGALSASASSGSITVTRATSDEAITVELGGSPAGGKFTSNFQIGANQGQSMTISIEDMRSVALGISGTADYDSSAEGAVENAAFTSENTVSNGTNNTAVERALDVSSHESAAAAIKVINNAIESVSAQRSELGAFQNRLDHTISNLGNSAENIQAAESRIRDVDMAREVMEMTKNNILSQASQAMLAQANQAPQAVLQLLG
ncbi:flagellin [Alkalihalophilus marmarensis]|uniref:flagellin N-terminal helical domain-containing protein n=1 Tax=Alkalihalophilus marmarensis TaxID=521377 RepID=UPI002E1BB744|nr:flagellin [Alkalihalophilus marmarensis]MED1603082.1 flagellin [Alkalihalophilus marmarensis]